MARRGTKYFVHYLFMKGVAKINYCWHYFRDALPAMKSSLTQRESVLSDSISIMHEKQF